MIRHLTNEQLQARNKPHISVSQVKSLKKVVFWFIYLIIYFKWFWCFVGRISTTSQRTESGKKLVFRVIRSHSCIQKVNQILLHKPEKNGGKGQGLQLYFVWIGNYISESTKMSCPTRLHNWARDPTNLFLCSVICCMLCRSAWSTA